MRRGDDTARGLLGDCAHSRGIAGGPGLSAIRGAGRQFAGGAMAEIGLQFRRGAGDAGGGLLTLFERPLLLGTVDQTQVVNTCILLRSGAGAHEVGYGDGGQQTDNRDDDHDFHQSETCLAGDFIFHRLSFFLTGGVNHAEGGL